MKYYILILSLLTSVLTVANNGTELLKDCSKVENLTNGDIPKSVSEALHTGACIGLIDGIKFGMQLSETGGVIKACFPNEGVTNTQAIKIVLKYLNDYPEELHLNKRALIVRALKKAFPC